MHRADVENPENALAGLVAGLRGVGGGGTFEGVALYAEWTTDDAEWATYERLWRNAAALGAEWLSTPPRKPVAASSSSRRMP